MCALSSDNTSNDQEPRTILGTVERMRRVALSGTASEAAALLSRINDVLTESACARSHPDAGQGI